MNKYKKISNILNNKILFNIILILFLIFAGIYGYIEITNTPHAFQRIFNKNIYNIPNIVIKITYLTYFFGIFLLIELLYRFRKFLNFIKEYFKKIINFYSLFIMSYIGIVFLFTDKRKNQIIAIISLFILYLTYKIYLYIKETKTKYKCKLIPDSRYLFLIALILLVYTPIFLYFNDKKIAESLSIYAYYALVTGVIYEIIISKFEYKKI